MALLWALANFTHGFGPLDRDRELSRPVGIGKLAKMVISSYIIGVVGGQSGYSLFTMSSI